MEKVSQVKKLWVIFSDVAIDLNLKPAPNEKLQFEK